MVTVRVVRGDGARQTSAMPSEHQHRGDQGPCLHRTRKCASGSLGCRRIRVEDGQRGSQGVLHRRTVGGRQRAVLTKTLTDSSLGVRLRRMTTASGSMGGRTMNSPPIHDRLPPLPLPDLGGRRAVVTGASAGIGLDTAAALAGVGAEVVLAVRSQQRADAAAARIRQLHPGATCRSILWNSVRWRVSRTLLSGFGLVRCIY